MPKAITAPLSCNNRFKNYHRAPSLNLGFNSALMISANVLNTINNTATINTLCLNDWKIVFKYCF